MRIVLSVLLGAISLVVNGQNVGIGTNTPAASAMLHINSINKGLLIPRLSSVQRAAIPAPATGLQVYDTDTNSFWYFNSIVWIQIGAGGGGGTSYWDTNGFGSIYNNNTGNLGVGTIYPGAKLDVNGNGFFKGPVITFNYSEQGGYYYSGGALNLSTPFSFYQNKVMAIEGNKFQSYTVDIDDASMDDYASDLSINPFGGNIGLGTANPVATSKVTLQTDDDYKTALVIKNPSGSARFEAYVGGPNNANTISLGTTGNMPIAIYTNSTNRIYINGSGNVGIGTDNPSTYYKLSVNGFIRAKEIRVNTDWADYVFEDNYQLKPLTEVEEFIKQHRHLPGVTNAATLQTDGVDLSAMQTKMMEKIEELTLYLIQANKKIEQLQKDNVAIQFLISK